MIHTLWNIYLSNPTIFLDARTARDYSAFPMEQTELAERMSRVMDGLQMTHVQAAVDAGVSPDTIRAALKGGVLKRPSTIQQLFRWVERAERRLERRVPRP